MPKHAVCLLPSEERPRLRTAQNKTYSCRQNLQSCAVKGTGTRGGNSGCWSRATKQERGAGQQEGKGRRAKVLLSLGDWGTAHIKALSLFNERRVICSFGMPSQNTS